MSKVFGIGISRTGTLSLCAAFRMLGYSSVHLPLNFEEIDAHDLAADISVAVCYQKLSIKYPDARFVLTVRPLEDWLNSIGNFVDKTDEKFVAGVLRTMDPELRAGVRGLSWGDPRKLYESHVADVMKFFEGSDRLLVFNLKEGWGPLCRFLNKQMPAEAFPHLNTGL